MHSPAANDGTIVKDHCVYVLTDADGTAAQGGLQFSHGGEVKPPVQVEQLQDEFLVAESDLAWGSDSGHEANNVGREG